MHLAGPAYKATNASGILPILEAIEMGPRSCPLKRHEW